MGNRSSREVYSGHSRRREDWIEGEGLVHVVDRVLGPFAVSAARSGNVERLTGASATLRLIRDTLDAAAAPNPVPPHSPRKPTDDDEQNELPLAA